VPEELRFDLAVLHDFSAEEQASEIDSDVNRASLYAWSAIDLTRDIAAYVEVARERAGRPFQAATTSFIIATLLWLGVASGLDVSNPGPAVSILLVGAAPFSGIAAVQGHAPVKRVFAAPRRWLLLATTGAVAGSATLAMEIPDQHPVALCGTARSSPPSPRRPNPRDWWKR
jgi:hypothetical protein